MTCRINQILLECLLKVDRDLEPLFLNMLQNAAFRGGWVREKRAGSENEVLRTRWHVEIVFQDSLALLLASRRHPHASRVRARGACSLRRILDIRPPAVMGLSRPLLMGLIA